MVLGANYESACDVAQETLVRCYRKWSVVQRADNREAYVYRILVNCFRDSKRRHWRKERPSETFPETLHSDSVDRVALKDAIQRAIGDLSMEHRKVVVLRYYGGLGEKETAEVLGVPPGTVKSRLARALSQLSTSHHISDSKVIER